MIKQKNVKGLGALVEALFNSLPFLSIINFLSILVVLYSTTFPYIKEYAPWINFWMFIGFLVALTLVAMFLVYKFVIPSIWTFRGAQMFGFDNEISKKLDKILERLERLEDESRNNCPNKNA